MNIKIDFVRGVYQADCSDLTGSPPIGVGKSPEMAVACLFHRLQFNKPDNCGGSWFEFIDKKSPLKINGVVWTDPCKK